MRNYKRTRLIRLIGSFACMPLSVFGMGEVNQGVKTERIQRRGVGFGAYYGRHYRFYRPYYHPYQSYYYYRW